MILQDELIVIPEEAFVSSDCCSDTESSKSIIEACQHSPYSVLEPFQDSPPSSLGEDLSSKSNLFIFIDLLYKHITPS